MYDPATGNKKGNVYVWATVPFQQVTKIQTTYCFSEFMVLSLEGGNLYTHSGP
jgi:hypothetical protein